MVNFGPLAAEIVSLVWDTPGNFNGFRVLDWVLSHWAHFTVLDSFLYCVLLCAVLHDCLGL